MQSLEKALKGSGGLDARLGAAAGSSGAGVGMGVYAILAALLFGVIFIIIQNQRKMRDPFKLP